jgi:hypothetical protein
MAELSITHLERRKIEAGVLIPMVQACQRPIGKERANEIARAVIFELTRKMPSDGRGSLGRIYRRWIGSPVSGQVVAVLRSNRSVYGNQSCRNGPLAPSTLPDNEGLTRERRCQHHKINDLSS